jgi:hypothetical protein
MATVANMIICYSLGPPALRRGAFFVERASERGSRERNGLFYYLDVNQEGVAISGADLIA